MPRHRPDNGVEIRGLEARAADQCAADLRHRKDRVRVRGAHGPAVENAYLPALYAPVRDETLTDMSVHLRDLFETRAVTGSNCP